MAAMTVRIPQKALQGAAGVGVPLRGGEEGLGAVWNQSQMNNRSDRRGVWRRIYGTIYNTMVKSERSRAGLHCVFVGQIL